MKKAKVVAGFACRLPSVQAVYTSVHTRKSLTRCQNHHNYRLPTRHLLPIGADNEPESKRSPLHCLDTDRAPLLPHLRCDSESATVHEEPEHTFWRYHGGRERDLWQYAEDVRPQFPHVGATVRQ